MNPFDDIATHASDTGQSVNPFFDIANQGTPAPSQNPFFDIAQSATPSTGDQWEDFKQTAKNTVAQRGLPQAVVPVLLGQAALESARGKSAPGNNYFGIKGHGTAGSNNLATQEYGSNGYYGENSNFGAYNTPQDSVNAYLDLIMGYKGVPEAVQGGDPKQILQAVQSNGYATSPTYVQNVMATPEFQHGQ